MTETDDQRKTRLLISYAWTLVRNAQGRIDDLDAATQDDDDDDENGYERAQLQQWLEFATQAAEELERLQAVADLAEILRATTDEYGLGSGEVVLTQTETGGVRIEMRCKPIADDTADGATIADAAREMVRRW